MVFECSYNAECFQENALQTLKLGPHTPFVTHPPSVAYSPPTCLIPHENVERVERALNILTSTTRVSSVLSFISHCRPTTVHTIHV